MTSDRPLPADPPAAPPVARPADVEATTDAPAVAPAVALPEVEPAPVAAASPGATAEPPAAPAAPDLSPAATGTRLAALFPALFVGPDGKGVWKPIKLRIHADIQARAPGEFSKRTLGIFFSRYTTTTPYLKALSAEGAQRFDLDGQPAGEISDEHRQLAVDEVARRQALAAERRAAMRPPRREPPAARRTEGLKPDEAAQAGEPVRGPAPRPEAGGDRPPPRHAERPRHAPQRPREGGPRVEGPVRREPGSSRPPLRGPDAGRRAQERPQAPRPQGTQALHTAAPREPAFAALPTDPAQRERAMLLRAFEASPLSKANFCALKGIDAAALDAALAQAKVERGPAKG